MQSSPTPCEQDDPGFTLLEMSIVLVVIALIAGSVTIGRSLLRNAELQSTIADVDRYKKAIWAFREKYKELPGDFSGAAALWGADSACPATVANAVPKRATCDGDGLGTIGGSGSYGNAMTISDWRESYRAWQHLANAALIDGQYNGATSSNTSSIEGGLNVPRQRIKGSVLTLAYGTEYDNESTIYSATGGDLYGGSSPYGHVLVFGLPVNNNSLSYNPAITTVDANMIDSKLDDGLPNLGNVMAYGDTTLPNCTTSSGGGTVASYSVTVAGINCSLIFKTGF